MRNLLTRWAAVVLLTVLAGVRPGRANQFTCFEARPGDTVARMALRLTGAQAHTHESWFQVFDPATSTFVPKNEYARLPQGWRACLASDRVGSELIARPPSTLEAPRSAQVPAADVIQYLAGRYEVWLALALLLTTMVAWEIVVSHSRCELVNRMTFFGERFVREFEQPLLRPGTGDRALESRVRVMPWQRRLDILLAPCGRHSYPNLSDHRTNVEYDVGRVLQRLGDDRFVHERLSAQGRWVVVRCRVRPDVEPGGGS